MPGDTPLLTDRLRIREWTLSDLPRLGDIYGDPEVMRFIGEGIPHTPERTEKGIRATLRRYEKDGMGMWCVEDRETGRILGHCGLQRWEGTTDTEIGWLLRRDAWGCGYATEAAREVLRHGFAEFEPHRIVAVARPENAASIAVMKRIGMTYRKTTEYKGTAGVVLYAVYRSSSAALDSAPT